MTQVTEKTINDEVNGVPILGVVGHSNTGKTRCIVKLVSILSRRGYRVATAKHCHHGFELDMKGKDSWRHKRAGAVVSLLSTGNQIAVVGETPSPLSLMRLRERYLYDVDLLLAEGYSREPVPKILIVSRSNLDAEKVRPTERLLALVGEKKLDCSLPQFSFKQLEELATLIEKRFLLSGPSTRERKELAESR